MRESRIASRRDFLRSQAHLLGAFALGSSFSALAERVAAAPRSLVIPGYGNLRPATDETTGLELIQLPEGFRYASFGWTGDPMDDGSPTPAAHDGMAVVRSDDGILALVRNHEIDSDDPSFGPASMTYDPQGGGGCTLLTFDSRSGKWLGSRPSLAGTVRNCAGGPTPWGTWLSCEETVVSPGEMLKDRRAKHERSHGWVFETSPDGNTSPEPIEGMGRFIHEAVAVDPRTGYVYETEDRGEAGLYRFLPDTPGHLAAGGRLQMLKIPGRGDLRRHCRVGESLEVQWVDIEQPERHHTPGTVDAAGVFGQGKARGATTFARLEGCWWGNGHIYFDATSGGDLGLGQIWQLDPSNERLQLLFESPGAEVLDSPDNLAVSPRGGIALCEDGKANPMRLHGLTPEGQLFPFATNNCVLHGERHGIKGDFRGLEWAGVTFSPDGQWLFANLQRPGLTLAITGPWGEGLL